MSAVVLHAGHQPAPLETVVVLGVPFAVVEYEQAVECIGGMLGGGGAHQVVLANAHALNLAFADEAYRGVLQRASLVLRDGIGVEIGARLAGVRLRHNFVGTDFIPHLLGSLARLQPSVFLYGAAPGIAARAAGELRRRCPAVRIVGTEHGYGGADDVVARVREARPDLLLVALGNPRQEQWIAANLDRLNARVAIGVGALFDYLSGNVVRAPRWMLGSMRSEWIFRLLVEPRRLWRRYLLGNPKFLWRLVTTRRQW